jgi:hypothetical protein
MSQIRLLSFFIYIIEACIITIILLLVIDELYYLFYFS